MEEKKNNGVLIGILIGIVIILTIALIFISRIIAINQQKNNIKNMGEDITNKAEEIIDKVEEQTNLKEEEPQIKNGDVETSTLNDVLDILGVQNTNKEVYKNNCLNSYISENNFRKNSKEIFAWYVSSHNLDTNHGNELTKDTNGDGKPDIGACGGAADCGTIKKSDADRIIKLYGLTNLNNQFTAMQSPYEDEYIINYFNLSGLHPMTCNKITKHDITAKYDEDKTIIITDKQHVTEYGYLEESEQIKSQKDQTVTYIFNNDTEGKPFLESVKVN